MKPAIFPRKLRPGDVVCVVAPATSMTILSDDVVGLAESVLGGLGLRVTYGKNVRATSPDGPAPPALRLADLHAAFADPEVAGILTVIGGYACNQLLDDLDYDLIRANPKVLCGFSDITALATAIYARSGLVTYSGPHFSTFGMRRGSAYTVAQFQRCVMEEGPFEVPQAATWSDDPWYREQDKRLFIPTEGYRVLQAGEATGRLLGGNLCTLNLLQGTRYMPDLAGSILLLEDDFESSGPTFDRDFQSLLHQPGAAQIAGFLFGRFQRASQIRSGFLDRMLALRPALAGLPAAAEASFGHTTPQFTFPIGGTGRLLVHPTGVTLTIETH